MNFAVRATHLAVAARGDVLSIGNRPVTWTTVSHE